MKRVISKILCVMLQLIKTVLNGSFVIEKDGTTSHMEISNSPDAKLIYCNRSYRSNKWIAGDARRKRSTNDLFIFGVNTTAKTKSIQYSY